MAVKVERENLQKELNRAVYRVEDFNLHFNNHMSDNYAYFILKGGIIILYIVSLAVIFV